MAGLSRALQVTDNDPRSYDLTGDPRELRRLLRECRDYLRVCRREHHGTDFEGRRFAIEALNELLSRGSSATLVLPSDRGEA